jgi:hypothetical protein
LAAGIGIGRRVVVEGAPLPGGTAGTICPREADESLEVPPELENRLSRVLESITALGQL